LLLAWVVWLRVSGARLRSVVMASLLAVGERLGMTVVGEPKALWRPETEAGTALPWPVAARLVTAFWAIPRFVRRVAGSPLAARMAAPR
jgi:hypothetical protein